MRTNTQDWLTTDPDHSYNRYLAVASRVVRRSLKEDKRIAAERRGQQDLRFAKWTVSADETHEGEDCTGKGIRRCADKGILEFAERQAGRDQEPG